MKGLVILALTSALCIQRRKRLAMPMSPAFFNHGLGLIILPKPCGTAQIKEWEPGCIRTHPLAKQFHLVSGACWSASSVVCVRAGACCSSFHMLSHCRDIG